MKTNLKNDTVYDIIVSVANALTEIYGIYVSTSWCAVTTRLFVAVDDKTYHTPDFSVKVLRKLDVAEISSIITKSFKEHVLTHLPVKNELDEAIQLNKDILSYIELKSRELNEDMQSLNKIIESTCYALGVFKK